MSQARRLIDLALSDGSVTALVYAALEARNAIERFVFEMSVVATGGSLTQEHLLTAQKKDGGFELLNQAFNNYRRHIEFQNICMEVAGHPICFAVPDIRRCKRLRTDLNPYCHCQLDPKTTVRDNKGSWFVSGVAIVQEACDFLDGLLRQPQGVLAPSTMPAEVKDVFDAFLAKSIDVASAKMSFLLLQPVLEKRFLVKGSI